MPVPATTGQLRDRIEDMKIGDYIKIGISNGRFFINPIGFMEAPIYGSAGMTVANNTFWYAIKVDKGLLISDRNIAHTLTWMWLNSANYIEGKPIEFTYNLVPIMTSNTTPSGEAYCSDEYDANYKAYFAFDGKKTQAETGIAYKREAVSRVNGVINFIGYKFPEPKKVKAYRITVSTAYNNVNLIDPSAPIEWTFEGSNDSLDWTILDTQTNISWTRPFETKEFIISNDKTFTHYRIKNASGYLSIGELELLDMPVKINLGVVRSLKGGVIWADKDSNPTITDNSLGAWPVNNEWDKYITRFPKGLITTGSTDDDVFHHHRIATAPTSGVYTWCQETPSINLANSPATNRVIRAKYSDATRDKIPSFGSVANTEAQPYLGFRPVFEYIE